MAGLLSVADALDRILSGTEPVETEAEMLPLHLAAERTLAEDIIARRTQPPFPASAMDGYAVRSRDTANPPVELRVIGTSAAGHGYNGKLSAGEAVRIFTGAPVPSGADAILIQENAETAGPELITAKDEVAAARYVRPAGLDFSEGETLLPAGRMLDPHALSLAAAANCPVLSVRRKPRVAIIATGDELVQPGDNPGPDQIVASNSFGVAAIAARAGAVTFDLGIAADTLDSLAEKFSAASAKEADIVVTLGGASVGDHDLVQEALASQDVELGFWKLAMRPGKPVMFGVSRKGQRPTRYLGLPGNPVSSLVCSLIFLDPLIRSLLGQSLADRSVNATLGRDLPQNDQREEYMRAVLTRDGGRLTATPFDNQDSSIISNLAAAEALLVRPAHAPPATKGDPCRVLLLD